MPSKLIVSVIMPSKGNKVVLNQFVDEPEAFGLFKWCSNGRGEGTKCELNGNVGTPQ